MGRVRYSHLPSDLPIIVMLPSLRLKYYGDGGRTAIVSSAYPNYAIALLVINDATLIKWLE